jgi:type I restriction enzyme M protein
MTSSQQRAALQRQIWQIANDVRGAVDGWDFKQYVLGTLFYRFISENFASYIEADDDSVNYAKLPDSVITSDIKDDAIKTKGYFIYPSQLFATIAASANTNESLNTDLVAIFSAIESSANGYPSERDIKGLFADFDTTSNRLGNTVVDKNIRLAAVLKGVAVWRCLRIFNLQLCRQCRQIRWRVFHSATRVQADCPTGHAQTNQRQQDL